MRNFFTASFTNPIGMARQSPESLVDFLEKLLFSLPNAERKILIGFGRSLITHIRKAVHSFPVGQDIFYFLKNVCPLPFQVSLNIGVLTFVVLATVGFRLAQAFGLGL
jgi:hypothetical protein